MAKMKPLHLRYFLIFVLIIAVGLVLMFNSSKMPQINEKRQKAIIQSVKLPTNFGIKVFASDLGKSFNLPGPNSGPRFMEFYNGVLFVSIPKSGMIVALPDSDNDAKADKVVKVIDGFDNPHGIAFLEDTMYIANEKSVVSVKINPDLTADKSSMKKLFDLPGGGGHWTRTIRIYSGSIYVSVGSSCNACAEESSQRASILKCSFEGKCEVFAHGTRNAVGFIFDKNGTIYATENSRDMLGEDLPPDEINIILKGKDYGWPNCYGNNIEDPDYGDGKCINKEPSFIDLQAHSAPLGIAINYGDDFHEEYWGKMFVAYHGSWNREIPTGYKIVVIDPKTKAVSDFATGWLTPDFKVIGRPVDIAIDKNGMMYVSDDNAGMIYKIFYEN